MLSVIESVNAAVNNFIWGVPAMICIIGVGLYLSIRTNFLQIRKFPYAIKVTIGRMLRKIPEIWDAQEMKEFVLAMMEGARLEGAEKNE